jgi:tRNA threonylcarbamoyladenosine biosynthesis protein TsaE
MTRTDHPEGTARASLPRLIHTSSPAETHAVAAALAERLRPGDVVAIEGDLGAGKTCFAQGVGRALGVREPMGSPTFTLINEYAGRRPVYHVDLYRLSGAAEALDLGLDEIMDGRA